jgi:hypothetical protein
MSSNRKKVDASTVSYLLDATQAFGSLLIEFQELQRRFAQNETVGVHDATRSCRKIIEALRMVDFCLREDYREWEAEQQTNKSNIKVIDSK